MCLKLLNSKVYIFGTLEYKHFSFRTPNTTHTYIYLHSTCTHVHIYQFTLKLRLQTSKDAKMTIDSEKYTLVWNGQQSFYLHPFRIIILPVLFCVCQIQIHCFIIELQYNHVLTL